MNPIEDDNDRFGVPLTALQAALSAHEGTRHETEFYVR
jgi:hypothetical protein